MDCETFLLEQGYDTTSTGGVIFSFLLEEVLFLMNEGASYAQIKKELKDIYSTYIYSFFKTNGSDFFYEIILFLKSKNPRNKKKSYKVDEYLFKLAKKYRIENGVVDSNNKEKSKVISKCK